jgi:uncharacterized membrane protein
VTRALVICAVTWPLLLGAATIASAHHAAPWLTGGTYLVCGRICHQRPERSFHNAGTQWPVCARCSGLYLGAPLAAIAAVMVRPRGRRPSLRWLALWAAPTAVTFVLEHAGVAPFNNAIRFAAALPLGAAIAWVIIRTADDPTGFG